MDTSVPKTIGRYEIDRRLGSGAMGHVYLGRDPELDRPVAIKVVRDLGLDADRLQTFLVRFRNEARAAARLSHPGIVQVYDVGQDERGGPYLVFEYVAGSSLKQILRARGPLDAEKVVRLAEEVAGAIDLAHAAGIIHRDIKPDNLLVRPDGSTKLGDFGVARIPDAALTREGQFLGTPAYAAPETLTRGEYGPASDLFSFGAVLYEAISGVRPWPGDDAVGVAHKVIHDEPPLPSQVAKGAAISSDVDRVLMRAIDKDPTKRYTSAASLAAALGDAFEASGIAVPRTQSSRPLPKSSTGLLPVAAVVLGLGALGTTIVLAFNSSPEIDIGDPSPDAEVVIDASILDASPIVPFPPSIPDAGDAGHFAPPDAASIDAGRPPIDASTMSNRDREEAAKDALARARRAIEAGDRAAAESALAEARELDPSSPEIEQVQGLLDEPPTTPPDPPVEAPEAPVETSGNAPE